MQNAILKIIIDHCLTEILRKKITKNFSELMKEIESPIITQTLNGCKNVTGSQKEFFSPAGGRSRRVRVKEFFKLVLNNDEYLLEFERVMKHNGLKDLLKSVEILGRTSREHGNDNNRFGRLSFSCFFAL